MRMAACIIKLYLSAFALLICSLVPAVGENLLSCETASPDAFGYRCSINGSQHQCGTYAILRTNPYFSSLSNLSFYLSLNRSAIAEVNGFSAKTEFLPRDEFLLIPIVCKCNGSVFQADVTKTTIKGESFDSIAKSLEGLTTCRAIQEQNKGVFPRNLGDKVQLQIPLRCACSVEFGSATSLLLSYPVSEGDTVSSLALKFNTTPESIVSANKLHKSSAVTPFSSLLIPVSGKPALGSLVKPQEPTLSFPASSTPAINPHKRKSRMWKAGIYIAVTGAVVGASTAIAAVFLVIQLKKKNKKKQQQGSSKDDRDTEIQHLSLSVRTTSEKKVSFERSQQDPLDGHIVETTPRKVCVETYTIEELRKATEDFNSSNNIDGSVYHGRHNGKSLAIKRTQLEAISKIDFSLFQNARHHHPNIIKLMGTCLDKSSTDAFLVFEFAKNGSLKDWLHGGLAMKNQFIASCECFLTWNQRLKVCLDVAVALQYMHQIMNPSSVHRNVKSQNIFLDEEFNAKLGNFGMARCSEDDTNDPDFYSATPASWGMGYLSPEYIHQGIVSPSMDIFAFGVVLLEVLSGQTPITKPDRTGEGRVWLSEKIKTILSSENADQLRDWMDSALGENYSFDAAVALANLARACVEEDASLRPNIAEIVDKLSKLVQESGHQEHILVSESFCKPLVMSAIVSM